LNTQNEQGSHTAQVEYKNLAHFTGVHSDSAPISECVNPTNMAVINAVHLVRIFYCPQYTGKAQLVITVDKTSENYTNPLKYSKVVACIQTLRCPHKRFKYFTD